MITSFSALTAGKAEATDLAKEIKEALIATGKQRCVWIGPAKA